MSENYLITKCQYKNLKIKFLSKICNEYINMKNKYDKQLKYIINIIKLKCEKNIKFNKKYIIKNKYMYYQIIDYIIKNNLQCKYKYIISQDTYKRKLIDIYNPNYNCCYECDKIKYYNKNVPVEYIMITNL